MLRRPARKVLHAESPGTLPPAKKYDAFISFSRIPDDAIAKELHYGLQRVAKRLFQRRSMRVFLDTATMAAGGPLWGNLKAALDESRFLVLIASPASASRQWVNREVEYWISDDSRLDKLIIVLADGEIKWDDSQANFDWSAPSSALPRVLDGKFKESQIFADFRNVSTKRGDPLFYEGVVSVAAKIHGVAKDDLYGEDRRQYRRNIRIAFTAIVVLVLMLATAVFLGKVAVDQRDTAQAQTRLALSRELAASATTLAPQNIGLASLLAVESNRLSPTPQARAALLDVLSTNPALRHVLPVHGQLDRLSDDGTEVAVSGYSDVTVQEAGTGRLLGRFAIGPKLTPQNTIRRVEYEGVISHDDHILATYDPRLRTIQLWDIARHRLLAAVSDPANNPDSIGEPTLVFSPDGRYLLSTGANGAYIFSAATLRKVAGPVTLPGALGAQDIAVNVAAFSPDSRYLMMAGMVIGFNFIFSTANWRMVSEFPGPGLTTANAEFSPNGQQLAVETNFGIDLYRITRSPLTATLIRVMNGPLNQYTVAWNPVGSLLASGGDDGTQLWNPATGVVVNTLDLHPAGSRLDGVTGIAFTRSGSRVITSGADGVLTWQPGAMELERQIRIPNIGPAVYSPDGKFLATIDGPDTVQLRNATTSAPVGNPIRPGDGTVRSVAFVGTSGLLAIGAQNGTVLWNLEQHRPDGGVLGRSRLDVVDVSASPDGTYVAASDGYYVSVWNVRDRRLVLKFLAARPAGSEVLQVVIGPDSRTLAVPVGRSVELWDIPKQRKMAVVKASGDVNSVAFTRNGEFLAINMDTPTTQLWNLQTQQWSSSPMSNGTISADSLDNNPVAVNGDGSLVAAASGAEDSVTLWDTASSSRIGVLYMPNLESARENAVTSISFGPDGQYLAITGNTGDLVLWDVSPDDWVSGACARAGRELTRAEWSQYIGPAEPYQRICS